MADEKQYEATLQQTAFGSERVPVLTLPGAGEVTSPAVQMDGPAIAVSDSTFAKDKGFRDAGAVREERANREDSSALVGMGAAVATWDTTRLIQRMSRPAFEDDTPIDLNDFFNNLDFAPTEDEREYIVDTAKGLKSAAYAVEQVQNLRMAHKVMGNHEMAGTAAMFLDPVWLAVPPALRLGKAVPVALGRTASAVAAGAAGAAITALGEGPHSDAEIALNIGMNAAIGTVMFRGGKLTAMDPQFPKAVLNEALQASQVGTAAASKPRYRLVSPAKWGEVVVEKDGTASRQRIAEAVYEEVPQELRPGAVNTDPATVVASVDTALSQNSRARGVADKIMWNMHKTMSGFGDVGRRVADMIYDNNKDLSLTSLESHRESILSGIRTHQFEYEDLMRAAMAEDGAGLAKMINPATSRQAYAVQNKIERQVQRELFRREQYTNRGQPIPKEGVEPRIAAMADRLDVMHKKALAEMKAAGVEGAENILERPGYLNRRWSSQSIDTALDKLEAMGLTREAGRKKVHDLVAMSLRLANPKMDVKMSKQIGSQIVDRALRKGMFEDGVFNSPSHPGTLAEMRDFMRNAGMSAEEIERGLDVLRVSTDEAGKAAYTKHRMDLDYRAQMRVGNETVSIMDLIDNRVTSLVDQYNQRVATNSAMARKGLRKQSDLDALRRELLESVPESQRDEAKNLFDNTMAHFRGDPSGAKVDKNFRLLMAYGRSISLAWSGLWQMTEFANAMGEFGLRKTLQYAAKEIPGFKSILGDKSSATSLNNVLSDHSVQSLRLRPYLAKFEDGYEMDVGSAMQLSAQTLGQMVPMANAMKYVHHAQAKAVGNLILDRLEMASKGNKQAREALAKYGIDSPVMDRVSAEIEKHGFEVDAWDDAVWEATRPAFAKMMDTSVLRSRLGDIPAFAAFDQLGKFVFTYRTFVLTAHNKILAGGLARNGAGAVGLVMMYQFPLALAAVQAQAYIRGKGTMGEDELVASALGQMGGLGLFSEPLKWATGQSNSVGSPAMIPIDRAVKLFQSGVQGDGSKFGSTLTTMIPTFSAIPFINGMSHRMKE